MYKKIVEKGKSREILNAVIMVCKNLKYIYENNISSTT